MIYTHQAKRVKEYLKEARKLLVGVHSMKIVIEIAKMIQREHHAKEEV